MLDRHKLLKWMVEKLEGMKSSNEAGQYLYLQLVIKVGFLIGHLYYISIMHCDWLVYSGSGYCI